MNQSYSNRNESRPLLCSIKNFKQNEEMGSLLGKKVLATPAKRFPRMGNSLLQLLVPSLSG